MSALRSITWECSSEEWIINVQNQIALIIQWRSVAGSKSWEQKKIVEEAREWKLETGITEKFLVQQEFIFYTASIHKT